MFASRQVEIPIYWGVGRKRERGIGAFAQAIERTAIPLLRKYIVPAAKRVGVDLLEFARPEIAEFVNVERNLRQLQRVCEDRLWEHSWAVVAEKKLQAKSLQQSL